MSINFIPNDPLAITLAPLRVVSPRAGRAASVAGYVFFGQAAEGVFLPGTPEFLFWQCREAALAAIETWETITNAKFKTWQKGPKIDLIPDVGNNLNAFYDRDSLSFFHASGGGKNYFSGASTDVVSHEAGHGFLDSIRPDFWDSMLFEVNAAHEATGDCVAILTALHDPIIRKAILPVLDQKNAVEGTAEELSDGIKVILGATHNAAAPRRARNTFQYVLPSTLPEFGDPGSGPGKLINEIHSYGQVLSGCFYDTLVNIFKSVGGGTTDGLLAAAQLAGRLYVKGISAAPQKPRFFREIGRAMLMADQADNNGANEQAIRTAFEGHGIALSVGVALAPETSLDGVPPTLGAKPSLGVSVKKDLLNRLDSLPGAKTFFTAIKLGAEKVGKFVHERHIPLDGLDKRLKGVIAKAPETVLIGESGGRAAVLGAMPESVGTTVEVETFVRSLLKKGAIDFGGKTGTKPLGMVVEGKKIPPAPLTHAIKTIGGNSVLVRMRFACACHHRLPHN